MRGAQYLTGETSPMQVEYFQIVCNGNELHACKLNSQGRTALNLLPFASREGYIYGIATGRKVD
jgi:hypothetical protein